MPYSLDSRLLTRSDGAFPAFRRVVSESRRVIRQCKQCTGTLSHTPIINTYPWEGKKKESDTIPLGLRG